MNLKWQQRFLGLAKEVASWSKDPSTKVGAVAVSQNGQVLGTGYNGFPRGIADTDDRYVDREVKYNLVVHAEMNCIFNAAYLGSASLRGATLYVHGLPVCHQCAKGIIQAGITKVVMTGGQIVHGSWSSSWELTEKLFTESGVIWSFIYPDKEVIYPNEDSNSRIKPVCYSTTKRIHPVTGGQVGSTTGN